MLLRGYRTPGYSNQVVGDHRTIIECKRKKEGLDLPFSGDPAGARTQDPNIKSVVLYQLSYGISVCQNGNRFRFGGANVRIYF